MRKTNKQELPNTLYKMIDIDLNVQHVPPKVSYVIDRGSLLHKILWIIGTTYQRIYDHYVEYVLKLFGKAIIVFDGFVQFLI